jgi:hypothetical protein
MILMKGGPSRLGVDHHVYAELPGGSRAARNIPLMPTERTIRPEIHRHKED